LALPLIGRGACGKLAGQFGRTGEHPTQQHRKSELTIMTYYSIVTLSAAAASAVASAIAAMPVIAAALDLDISSYRETFSETFRGPLDVTPWGPSKWIAHTPWNGDFGDARFADPTSAFHFQRAPAA
jgi:hypothetical protein